jgi:hypothetical protein
VGLKSVKPQAPDNQPHLCPSANCRPGSVLLGFLGADGTLAYVRPRLTIDNEFVDKASAVGPPEKRFRFAAPCIKSGCVEWTGARCQVIERALTRAVSNVKGGSLRNDLPPCTIRSECRWFGQEGPKACGVCPHVMHDDPSVA